MAAKRKKTTKNPTIINAGAFVVGSVRSIQINLGAIEVAELPASFVKIRGAIKIPILFLCWDSPEEENRQSEKLHSTLNFFNPFFYIGFSPTNLANFTGAFNLRLILAFLLDE
jgi:hypothetical protein